MYKYSKYHLALIYFSVFVTLVVQPKHILFQYISKAMFVIVLFYI